MRQTTLTVLAALALASCATTGNRVLKDEAAAAKVQAVMTAAQVRAVVGEPMSVTTTDARDVVWVYLYTTSAANAATFVPIVGLFAGRITSQSSRLVVSFGPDGLVKTTSRSRTDSQVAF